MRSFDPNLARLIHATRRAIRDVVEANDFVEIAHPHLDVDSDVAFYRAFRVTIPNVPHLADFRGSLLVSGGRYMIEGARQVGKVYRIGPSFRADPEDRPNLLFEFHGVHITHEGRIGDSRRIVEQMLEAVIAAAAPFTGRRAAELEKVRFPLTQVEHRDATRLLGLETGQDLKMKDQLELLRRLDVPVVLLTGAPPSADPYVAFHRIDADGRQQNFDLLMPFGGEVLGAMEYETHVPTLRGQLATSRLLRRAVELGVKPEDYAAPTIQLLGLRDRPMTSVYGGFERLVQFLGGFEQIREAAIFPVTTEFLRGRA